MGNKKATPVVKNAIDYIEESSLFTNDKYNWIVQLIRLVLDDTFQEGDIETLIGKLVGGKNKKKQNKVIPTIVNTPKDSLNPNSGIAKIKSIDKLDNVGLVALDEPFNFKDGLNVFFGKNGAGKSTLYMGVCRTLGYSKRVFPNINFNNKNSCCVITYEGADGKNYQAKWEASNGSSRLAGVKIFDSLISNFIVQHGQENKFEMAHLKIEYFSKLHDLYDLLEKKLTEEVNVIEDKKTVCKKLIQSKAPFLFENGEITLDEKVFNTIVFSEKDKNELASIEGKISLLEKGTADSLIKNIDSALEEIKEILVHFGKLIPEETNNGKDIISKWELSFDEKHLDEVNEKIKQYRVTKAFIKQQGKNKIASALPEKWLSSSVWETFIKSSIDFLNTLDDESKAEFSKKKCVYCKQDLKSDESKKLIEAYQELSQDLKDKLDNLKFELNEVSDEMVSVAELFKNISASNKKIVAEFEHIGKDKQTLNNIDFSSLKNDFETFAKQIKGYEEIAYKECLPGIKKALDIYVDIYELLQSKLFNLRDNTQNKETKLEEYNKKVKPLIAKRDTIAMKDEIFKYFKLNSQHQSLLARIGEISTARQLTSTIKTTFTSKETLNEFKTTLNDEYELFDFSMPSLWEIKPITRDGVNKRVYSIGDKQLVEIFSEGEQKVHSLSDFFAQCRMEKYKGVYIFDDPVNSLDEDNIELVADRIKKLVDDGNQVIVFTHNLYFLNSLVDTQRNKVNKLKKEQTQIKMIKDVAIGDKQEMKDTLTRIKDMFSKLDENEPDLISMRNIYDLISGYLEDYIEKIYFRNIIGRYRANIRMQSLNELSSLDTSVIPEISKLFEKSSRRCSRHSQPTMTKKPTYSEIKEDIETLETNYSYK